MNSIEQKLLDKELAKKVAREQALPLRERIVKATGKIKVFLLHEQKYANVFPVDAREMLEMNRATLEPIEVVKGTKKIKIASDQLEDYIEQGFLLEGEEPEGEQDAEKPLEDMKLAELKEEAAKLNIIDFDGKLIEKMTKKSDVIEAIQSQSN